RRTSTSTSSSASAATCRRPACSTSPRATAIRSRPACWCATTTGCTVATGARSSGSTACTSSSRTTRASRPRSRSGSRTRKAAPRASTSSPAVSRPPARSPATGSRSPRSPVRSMPSCSARPPWSPATSPSSTSARPSAPAPIPAPTSKGGLDPGGLVALDPGGHLRARLLRSAPATHLHPFAGLEVLVVLEEVLDRQQALGREVGRLAPVLVDGQDPVEGHGEQLGVSARLVLHLQHAERAARHDRTDSHRERRDHENVDGIAVFGDGVGYVAVVAGILHRRDHEAIDEQRPGFLVHFVLDRVRRHRELDDDVELVRYLRSGADTVEIH